MTSALSRYAYAEKIVVAHRCASGYLSAHCMAAKLIAYAMDVTTLSRML